MPLEKLKKVVEMAKHAGSEGERANARRILERECKERGISVADALAGIFIKFKTWVHPSGLNVMDSVDFSVAMTEQFQRMKARQEDLNRRMKKAEERRRAYMEHFRRRAGG